MDTVSRMQKLVDTVMESQRFFEDYSRKKEKDAEEYKEKDPPPVFNKRLYVSTGSVVITNEARRIMARNELARPESEPETLTKTELMVMRNVVDGLKLIHKGHDYIKDALSHVITFETHLPHSYIVKREEEARLSCFFIVQGAVEVTYDMRMGETRSVYQPNIIYNHGTGEFLGLVSAEGLSEDLSPPATIYIKEKCEFLRIDRDRFHKIVAKYAQAFDEQKRKFMSLPHCALSEMPEEAKEKILDKIYRQEFPPNRKVLLQGDSTDFLHFVYSGRCKLHREIFIPEAEKKSKFFLRSCEEGSYFGEECILGREGSYCTVTTATHAVIFKLHKSAFEVVSKEHLHHLILQQRHEYPDEAELQQRGYTLHTWNDYKHNAVRSCLQERGHLKYMFTREPSRMRTRPPTACDRNKENMYRFMEKGAQYEPLRMGNISSRVQSSRALLRPRTAIGLRHSTPLSNHSADSKGKDITGDEVADEDEDEDDDAEDFELSGSITQMPSDMARLLAKHVGKQLPKDKLQQLLREGDCRELLKLLDESSEVGRQLRMALEAPSSQDGFTKTTVLMTMKTDDIVRKAKELAETTTDNRGQDDADDGQEWNTILHEENRTAKAQIAADRFRVAHLRKKMRALERKRETLRSGKMPQDTFPVETDQAPPGGAQATIPRHSETSVIDSQQSFTFRSDVTRVSRPTDDVIDDDVSELRVNDVGDNELHSYKLPNSTSLEQEESVTIDVLQNSNNQLKISGALHQGQGQTQTSRRLPSCIMTNEVPERVLTTKQHHNSHGTQKESAGHHRRSFVALLEKSSKRRPTSAPIYRSKSSLSILTRRKETENDFKPHRDVNKGRQLSLARDHPGSPLITNNKSTNTRIPRSPRGKIAR